MAQRFAVELRELRRAAGNPGYRELARRAHYSATTLAEAAGGGRLPSLQVTLAYVRACGGNVQDWQARWTAAAEEFGTRAVAGDGRPPYLGLAVYGPEDTDRFFGRQRMLAVLIERLDWKRFVVVVGASGSGKSSLLRAGLLPALTAKDRLALLITPGARPLQECAIRLGAELRVASGQLVTDFGDHPRNLGLAMRRLRLTGTPDGEAVLVVDQFEEVFTLCADAREREQFIAALVTAANDAENGLRVVLGLRADFYAQCARQPLLAEALQDAQVLVGPMNSDELREAVTQPAVRAGLVVDDALVATVLTEAGTRPGALPFVSHVLWETWRRRRGTELTMAAYEAAGGLDGALAQSADRVYGGLDEEQRRTARAILLRLTALGEGTEDTRRRVGRAELGTDGHTVPVLHRLAAARLITLGDDTAEIAHEALIDGWPTLRDWLAADREKLHAHRRLTQAVADWHDHGQDEALLYRGSPLAAWQDRELDGLNTLERAFLAASVDKRDREQRQGRRRRKLTLAGLGSALVVMSLLAALAVVQTVQAAEARDLARSRQAAASARGQLQADPELALLLAIRAVGIRRTTEAEAVLRQAVVDSRAMVTLPAGQGRSLGVAFSPDGRRLVTSGDDGTIRMWQRSGQSWTGPTTLGKHDKPSWNPVFSPDGLRVASGGNDSTVRIWDLTGGRSPVVLRGHRGYVFNVAFSPDGRRLASTADDGARIWDLATERSSTLLADHDGPAYGVAFSPDGRLLATSGHSDGTLRIRDLSSPHKPLVLRDAPGTQGHLVFSPDGNRLASTGADGSIRLWDPTGKRDPVVLHVHEGIVLGLAFRPDGQMIASSGQDGTIRIIDSATAANSTVLRGHRGEAWSVAFSPDGRQLASVGTDDTLRLWSATLPGDPTVLSGHDGAVWTAAFTEDGSRIASGGADATVRIWRVGGRVDQVLRGHRDEILDVEFSSDGRHLASADDSGLLRLWNLADGTSRDLATGDGAIWSLAFSLDGRRLAATGSGGTIRVWSVDGSARPLVLPGYQANLSQLDISPDGRHVASAGTDGVVRLQAVDGPGQVTALRGHQGPVSSIGFSRDGRWLASGGHDGTLRVWPVGRPGDPVILRGHQGVVWNLAFSPDGRRVATSSSDGTLRVWDVTGGGYPVVFTGYQASVETVSFSPDGTKLLTSHDDGTVRVQQCVVCGPLAEVLALATAKTSRTLTPDETRLFGLDQRNP
ncbi:hypothetical protein Aph01nite_32660 [Acrocarpospora phusangensis]|uniref:Novel STAND NTPase 1 domain-containing protein n=1 Tax=Acrocarpospora phusangensis TaxID=1070424 RepID=A0A919QA02_9ACTN|nr:hypothetical protein [Acrocarpospora phusangensis]GIH24956.1 hypothetical protein Aph01nite_32660 [Acrocarpospora phusangensis]